MIEVEKIFEKTDFSKESSFKTILYERLFVGRNVIKGSFPMELSDDELDSVNAAGVGPEKNEEIKRK